MKKIIHFILPLFIISTSYADTVRYSIKGIDDPLLTNANKHLKIEEDSYHHPLSEKDIKQFYEKSERIIQESLQPYGYFNAKIKSKITKQKAGKQKDEWLATYVISKGPAMHITRLDVQIAGEGKNNKKLREYLAKLPLKNHDIFDAEKYQKIKDQLFLIANEEGFIKANFQMSKIVLNTKTNTAQIQVILNTNKRYYLGKINFASNAYSTDFLRRFYPKNIGKPFSTAELVNYQQTLLSSYYFQNATITPDFDHIEDDQIPVTVDAVAPKAQHYIIGVGYGTSTGPRVSAGLSLRRLTEDGHHLDTQIKFSRVLSGLAAKYSIPGQNPITDEWTLAANLQQFMPKNGRSQSITLSAGYQTKIHDIQTNLSLNYLVEHYKITDLPDKHSFILYPSLNLLYVETDDAINPNHGLYLNYILQGGSTALLSSATFIQSKLKGKYIFSPFHNSGRFILRGELGYTAVQNLQALPLSMRFFTGGLNSVRAFKDSSIGPGKYLKVGSIEYQHQITGNWEGALFYDIGTAANSFHAPLNQSRGVGVIYVSVVGPIKLYLAQKDIIRNNNTHKQAYGIEFSIGPEF